MRTPHREPRRCANGPARVRVLDVLAVCGDDERSATRQDAEQPGRHQEVGVGDVGPERARRAHDVPRQSNVTAAAAAAIDDSARELVPACPELALELGDERAQSGVPGRVHLRDEQDPHSRSVLSADVGRAAVRSALS